MAKLMVSVNSVSKGMYVAELDRPWLDSPFIFQGFRITNTEEISLLKDTCEFVYIDQQKSTITIPKQALHQVAVSRSQHVDKLKLVNAALPYQSSFEEELPLAWSAYSNTLNCVRNALNDVRIGNNFQSEKLKSAVSALTQSVIRHPDALTLLSSISDKSKFAESHAINVCVMCLIFGRYLGFDESRLKELGVGALLHDVGEILVPNKILLKQGEKSGAEAKVLRSHTKHGAVIISKAKNLPASTLAIARDHHERSDGSGYPNRLTGANIDILTKIVSIVDFYDTATSGLYGKPPITSTLALKNIYDWREQLFDAHLVEKFIQCLGIYPVGSVVEFRSGELGIVVSAEPKMRLTPKLLLIRDTEKNPILPPKLINLALFQQKGELEKYKISRVIEAEQYSIDIRHHILEDLSLTLLSA